MMNINRCHILFWVSFSGFFMMLDYIQFNASFNIVRQLYMAFLNICTFYSFLFALVQFKKGGIGLWSKSIALFLLSFSFIGVLNYVRGLIAQHYKYTLFASFSDLLVDTIYTYTALAFYAAGYYYLNRSNSKEKELRKLAEQKAAIDIAAASLSAQNAQLEMQNTQMALTQAEMKQNLLQLENDFLRAQINPHFLYNTLNVFYAKAMDTNPDLADGLVKLAEVMRYSLEATNGNQLAPLQTEVGHLERVIAIHRLRFGDDMKIEFTTEGPYGLVGIAPLILITLLENALKYGDVESGASPIRLRLCVDARHIYFTLQNKKNTLSTGENSLGIGLGNVRRRLTNVYGNDYTLEVIEETDTYHVALVIVHNTNVSPNEIGMPTNVQDDDHKIELQLQPINSSF